ncbi:MAG: biopolymer transporter ExbD [Planctomycetota bacterium]|nr:MAG: biopolymer transporter ExbD [Planctomycetota bacterium]
MPLKLTEETDEPTLNLTPLVDIVFLLVIFFMVGTQFTADEGEYDIALPEVGITEPLTALPDEIVVTIYPDGRLRVGDEWVSTLQLRDMLVRARGNYPDQAVIVRGDSRVPYQRVMDVLSVCREAGITDISLANRPRGTENAAAQQVPLRTDTPDAGGPNTPHRD